MKTHTGRSQPKRSQPLSWRCARSSGVSATRARAKKTDWELELIRTSFSPSNSLHLSIFLSVLSVVCVDILVGDSSSPQGLKHVRTNQCYVVRC